MDKKKGGQSKHEALKHIINVDVDVDVDVEVVCMIGCQASRH